MNNQLAMATTKKVANNIAVFVQKNAPQILAGTGIGLGIVSTGLAVKGTIKATEIVWKLKEEKEGAELTKADIVKATWKEYVPTVGTALLSAGCIVGSVNISMRRIATMATAYALSEKSFKEYKDKAVEMIGEKKEEEIRGSIAQDFIDKNPPESALICSGTGGSQLCLDRYSGQYFYSDADEIRRRVNGINNQILHDFYISYNDYCVELGLNEVKNGNDLGWNIVDGDLLDVEFTTELGPGEIPILVVDFVNDPFPNYRRYM